MSRSTKVGGKKMAAMPVVRWNAGRQPCDDARAPVGDLYAARSRRSGRLDRAFGVDWKSGSAGETVGRCRVHHSWELMGDPATSATVGKPASRGREELRFRNRIPTQGHVIGRGRGTVTVTWTPGECDATEWQQDRWPKNSISSNTTGTGMIGSLWSEARRIY